MILSCLYQVTYLVKHRDLNLDVQVQDTAFGSLGENHDDYNT